MDDFHRLFGHPATAEAQANGRVNLIGEHTDYNGGFVLPTLIPQHTRVWLAPRDNVTFRAASVNISLEPATFNLGAETPRGDWLDYIQGVTRTLRDIGHVLRG